MVSFVIFKASDQISRYVKKETGRAEEVEKLLEQGEKAFKEHEQMLRLVNKDMAKKVEELEKEKSRLAAENLSLKNERVDSSKQHSADLEEVMAESQTSAAIVVLQARMEMAEEDPSTWDVTGWKNALKRLMGTDGEVSVDEKVAEEIDGSKSIVATS